jgi:hypothetical protein
MEEVAGQRPIRIGDIDLFDVMVAQVDETVPAGAVRAEGRQESFVGREATDGVHRDRVIGRRPQVCLPGPGGVACVDRGIGQRVYPVRGVGPSAKPALVIAVAYGIDRCQDFAGVCVTGGGGAERASDFVVEGSIGVEAGAEDSVCLGWERRQSRHVRSLGSTIKPIADY